MTQNAGPFVGKRIPGLWIVCLPVLGNGRGRSPRRHERWQSAPQVEMKQDFFDQSPQALACGAGNAGKSTGAPW
jgi:hypothetical protein